MSDKESINMFARINEGLKLSFERMLKEKSQLNQTVIFADAEGNLIEMTASEALNKLHENNTPKE